MWTKAEFFLKLHVAFHTVISEN